MHAFKILLNDRSNGDSEIEKCSAKSFVCFISLLSIFNALAMAGMDCEC